MQKLKVDAPAKVNLRLDVISRRKDGYHDLRSIIDRISVSDEIEISLRERGIELSSDNPNLPLDESNIVYQAAKEILAYSSRNVGVHIHIKKNIPIASGLGGGSSNAAAVIKGLNLMLKLKLSKEKLMKIGSKLGADVPFFLMEGPALAEGIGDELKKIRSIPKMYMILINPNVSVSTEWVYKNFPMEEMPFGKSKQNVKIPMTFTNKREIIKLLKNDLEMVTLKKYPIVEEIKEMLRGSGAMGTLMSGSGPTVFAIYSDKNKREIAFTKLFAKFGEKWKILRAENLAA